MPSRMLASAAPRQELDLVSAAGFPGPSIAQSIVVQSVGTASCAGSPHQRPQAGEQPERLLSKGRQPPCHPRQRLVRAGPDRGRRRVESGAATYLPYARGNAMQGLECRLWPFRERIGHCFPRRLRLFSQSGTPVMNCPGERVDEPVLTGRMRRRRGRAAALAFPGLERVAVPGERRMNDGGTASEGRFRRQGFLFARHHHGNFTAIQTSEKNCWSLCDSVRNKPALFRVKQERD
jgi:hypothetical protein